MIAVKFKDLKKGQWFTLFPVEFANESDIYIRYSSCNKSLSYNCYKLIDVWDCCKLKGNAIVYVDFNFKF